MPQQVLRFLLNWLSAVAYGTDRPTLIWHVLSQSCGEDSVSPRLFPHPKKRLVTMGEKFITEVSSANRRVEFAFPWSETFMATAALLTSGEREGGQGHAYLLG